jgi:hypothetical protein
MHNYNAYASLTCKIENTSRVLGIAGHPHPLVSALELAPKPARLLILLSIPEKMNLSQIPSLVHRIKASSGLKQHQCHYFGRLARMIERLQSILKEEAATHHTFNGK